ncbi:hypothetical protein POX_f07362 [Penicillium oxalicum]|uniref:hypothetical protein n=1 Tax=Penicillium oxalicum TaxID=69781 RepID=UPI0020B8E2CF|nr:hypothetical protein POX_f07362 [Penicillium oxalicum]KAI2787009.1 hypothetical protein POX_f07362 [Penicillium oxalicum]
MNSSADDASSIYSRPPDVPKRALTWDLIPIILPIRHDLPEINSLDHQIAVANGSTMALETTRTRMQNTKARNPLSLAELKAEKLRQRDQQETENQFYRSCFENLGELLSDVLAVAHMLELGASGLGQSSIREIIVRLRAALDKSRVRDAQAEQEWKRQWSISRIWRPAERWL